MAAASTFDLPEVALPTHKEDVSSKNNNEATQVHTPPASDMSSHGRKDDDDAASSSSLSDLEDDIINDTRFDEGITGAGVGIEEAADEEIEPDRYEGGIPIFTPVCLSVLFLNYSPHPTTTLSLPAQAVCMYIQR